MKLSRPFVFLLVAMILSAAGAYYYVYRQSLSVVEADSESTPPAGIEQLLTDRYPNVSEPSVDAEREAYLASAERSMDRPLSDYRVIGQRNQNVTDRTKFFSSALQPTDLSDKRVRQLNDAVMYYLGQRNEYNDDVSYADVKAVLDKLPQQTRSLPLARFAALRLYRQHFSSADGTAEYDAAAEQLVQADCSPLLCTLAALEEVLIRKQTTDPVAEEKLLLRQTERMIESYSKPETADDIRFAAEVLFDISEALTDRGRRNLLKALLQNSKVDDALVHLLAGEHYRAIAWQDRGGGFAQSVDEAGWESFAKHMAKASLHYQKSWLLRPDLPQAPDRMIMVSQAFGNKVTPRQWLELTLQADFDYPAAIWSYVHALRPRWGGSLQAMLEFGLECADTKDFESNFANHLYATMEAIVQEAELPNGPSRSHYLNFIRDYPGLHDRLHAHWQAEQNARADGRMSSACRTADSRSWRAAVAMLFDDQEQLTQALNEDTKCEATLTGFKALFAEPRIQRSLCDGLVTEHAKHLRSLEAQVGPDIDPQITKEALTSALETIDSLQADLDGVASDYLAAREGKLEQMFRYRNDEWVYLTFKPNLDLWTVFGDARIEDEHTAVISSYSGFGPAFVSRIPFAPPYEIVATFKLLDGRKKAVMSGIRLGEEGITDSRIDVAVLHHGQAGIYWIDSMACHSYKMPNEMESMTIRVHVWPGHYDAQFNGMRLPIPVRPGFEPASTLQFGGRGSQNFGAIRMSNLRVHRLPPRIDPARMSLEESDQWYQRLVQIDPEDRFAKINLAQVRLQQQRFSAARTLLEAAAGSQGLPPGAWPVFAQLEFASGNFDQAQLILMRLIQSSPDVPEYRNDLAWLLAATSMATPERGAEALQVLQPILQQHPGVWQFKVTHAAALAAAEQPEQATSELLNAIADAPPEQHDQLNRYLKQLKDIGRIEYQLPQDADAESGANGGSGADGGSDSEKRDEAKN